MYWAEQYGRWLSQHAGTDISKAPIRPEPERLRRSSVLGAPPEVRRRLAQIIEQDKLTDLIINTQFPGLDPARALRSLERFGMEVLPFLK
jgi:alkanesulfonate monooxygenase SsuD/methylene tetrahydromethanopterin reductase-like flavin-dependent oxidoreductase (luciferase family)